jgi:hypothetical protein
MNTRSLFVGESVLVRPRRECAPAWRLTFFAGAKKVSKETPNTSLFERWWLRHLTRLQRVVRSGATSIYGDAKGLLLKRRQTATFYFVIPAVPGKRNTGVQTKREAMSRRDAPKTSPERQWPLAESRPHVCTPASNHLSPNRLVFRCFLGDFFCTSKRSYSAAGPNTRRSAPSVGDNKRRHAKRLGHNQGALTWTA